MITILDAIAPTALEAFDALLTMMTEEGGDWTVAEAVALPLGGFQITATRNPCTDAELAALKAAATGTKPNSVERCRVERAIHDRRIARDLRLLAEREERATVRNAAHSAARGG